MPFDGIAVKNIIDHLNESLSDGRIDKALQPEKDEIVLVIRARGENRRLLLSASANCARIHTTDIQKENPAVPPVFCMLLRKHIVGGKILNFKQIEFDRIVQIEFQTTNDFGESCKKFIIIEIMGRHSNIILLNEDMKILDSIKHIDYDISSVREVMPGRQYLPPPSQNKIKPETLYETPSLTGKLFSFDNLSDGEILSLKEKQIYKFLLDTIKGFSPMLAKEICRISDVDPDIRCNEILFGNNSSGHISNLCRSIDKTVNFIFTNKDPSGYIYYRNVSLSDPFDFYFYKVEQYEYVRKTDTFCKALDLFYSERDNEERLRQKKYDLNKIITNNIDRCLRKIGIQEASLRDAAKSEKYKLYGELLTVNLYQLEKGLKSISLTNYYSENMEEISVPLDPDKTPNQNAQNYFRKYSKAKSTLKNASMQLKDSKEELYYLRSVMQMFDQAKDSSEINDIKSELISVGYIKPKKSSGKSGDKNKTTKPRVFFTSEGNEILVGKNNIQNDTLTLKTASNSDYWFHVKDFPGSHVILRTKGTFVSESSIKEAAQIAAFYSKASESDKVPVDYTFVRNVHKPNGAKPGMVIYENQKTVYVTPNNGQPLH